MLSCQNCETPQFLQIASSRAQTVNSDSVTYIEETVECTLCGSEGTLEYDLERNAIDVSGDLENTDSGPLSEPDSAKLITDGGVTADTYRGHGTRDSELAAVTALCRWMAVITIALFVWTVISP